MAFRLLRKRFHTVSFPMRYPVLTISFTVLVKEFYILNILFYIFFIIHFFTNSINKSSLQYSCPYTVTILFVLFLLSYSSVHANTSMLHIYNLYIKLLMAIHLHNIYSKIHLPHLVIKNMYHSARDSLLL